MDKNNARWAIVCFSITQGEPYGSEVATFGDQRSAEAAFEEGRKTGEYKDEGHPWSGRTEYVLLVRRNNAYYTPTQHRTDQNPTQEEVYGGPDCGIAPPTIHSPEVGGTWSPLPSLCSNWPANSN